MTMEKAQLTVAGGRIASKRSTPNMPRLERTKVPTKRKTGKHKQNPSNNSIRTQ
jgi:hypothetical protein